MSKKKSTVRRSETAAPAMKYTIHAVAAMFPLLPKREFNDLKKDVELRGILEPIVMKGSELIDGRNRMAVCEELGIKPPTMEYAGNDVVGYILARNVLRRHLTDDQRVAIVAKARGKELEKEAAESKRSGQFGAKTASAKAAAKGEVGQRIATEAKVSGHKGRQAAAVAKHAPDQLDAVIDGKKKLQKAAKVAKARKPVKTKKATNKPAPTVKEVVQKRFIKFMDFWPVTAHREVKKYLRELLS